MRHAWLAVVTAALLLIAAACGGGEGRVVTVTAPAAESPTTDNTEGARETLEGTASALQATATIAQDCTDVPCFEAALDALAHIEVQLLPSVRWAIGATDDRCLQEAGRGLEAALLGMREANSLWDGERYAAGSDELERAIDHAVAARDRLESCRRPGGLFG